MWREDYEIEFTQVNLNFANRLATRLKKEQLTLKVNFKLKSNSKVLKYHLFLNHGPKLPLDIHIFIIESFYK